jgi:Uma2 family endonuclease
MHDLNLIEEVVDIPGTVRIAGKVIARNVPYEQFMETEYGERHVEWVNGVVIEMSSIDERHDALVEFLRILFKIYLELTNGGRILGDPMLMKLESVPSSRAPDIQLLLPERLHQLKKNQVIGPANLVVEVVSPGSQRQDRVDKRREYELGSVPEYWLVDPQKQESIFSQLNESGVYETVEPDASGIYHSLSLSRLHFPVALLWRETLPSVAETIQMVQDMLK